MLYSATYSGTKVYEMEVNDIIVMRRRKDQWLNATQILKVAGVEKGKRTKVLEKEILPGQHEKVQGGYGKYQGTWISYARGVEFCRQYKVDDVLRPLLEYDMGQDGVSQPGSGSMETPTKEQAMAAQRKRQYSSTLDGSQPNGQNHNGTFFSNISSTATTAIAAIGKAGRLEPQKSRPNSRPSMKKQTSFMNSQEANYPAGSQQSTHSFASESSVGGTRDSTYGSGHPSYQPEAVNGDAQEPPRKRMRPSSSMGPRQDDELMHDSALYGYGSPGDPNDSFSYQQSQATPVAEANGKVVPRRPLPNPETAEAKEHQRLLISLFLDPSQTDFSSHPAFQRVIGENLDTPLDKFANTAVHWAAFLARIPLLIALINHGASIYRVNTGGETALDKASGLTNNFESGTFLDLLELLGPTIEIRDARGRTILHKIALSCAVKGRMLASKYYLESLLEFIVRQGSPSNSQTNSFSASQTPANFQPINRSINLARFLHDIVNAQDKSGDTALNIAARAGSRSIIQQLLEVEADPNIPNRVGLRPKDFGIGTDKRKSNSTYDGAGKKINETMACIFPGTREVVSSMMSVLTEVSRAFGEEQQGKQRLIDGTHNELREESAKLSEERRELAALQASAAERSQLRQRIINLRQNINTERSLAQPSPARLNGLTEGVDTLPMDAVRVARDADVGIAISIDASLLPADPDAPMDQRQLEYIASLPPVEVLLAQTRSYEAINAELRGRVQNLKNRSIERENTYRKVVAKALGCSEMEVDKQVPGLLAALESETDLENVSTCRTRELIKKVEVLAAESGD
ncbi:MAG: transcriptional regulator swi6 [Vezdaea aestivalis]|nr:MAG: transcriptional regulator swi6 [Vezdaea aestivalis]